MKRWIIPLIVLCLLPSLAAWAQGEEYCSFGRNAFDIRSPFLGLFGLGLIVLEFLLPTKGFLGLLGAIFFVMGSSSLINNPCPDWRLSATTVVVMNVLVLGTAALIGFLTIRGYTRHSNSELNPVLNQTGHVIEWTDNSKRVEVGGSVWLAQAGGYATLQPGQKIIVTGQDNLTLTVKPSGENA
jgi:membrane-bound ClpP family serine protease